MATDAGSSTAKLPFRVKVLYGFGSIAFGAKAQMLGLLLLFYNQVMGVPAQLVSLALGISIFVDALWDPLIGQLSDKTRTRWGRRHPFMYASAIPVSVCFVLLWNPPASWSHTALFVYLLAAILSVRLATSFYEVPSSALSPELAPDYHERTVLLGYRYVFLTLGGALANVIAFGIFLKATTAYPTGQLNPNGYGPLSLTIAALIVCSILISTLGTHHKIAGLHRPSEKKNAFRETIREVAATLRNWNFGVAVAAGLSFGMLTGLSGGLAIYFATYFWGLASSDILILVLSGVAAAPVAAFVAPAFSRRIGKRKACMILFLLAVAIGNTPILLRLLELFPSNGSPYLVPILFGERFFTAVLGVSGFIIVSSMIADIVEDSQIKTGRRSEGLLFSADSVVQKTINGLATVLPGLLLAFVGFPAKANPSTLDPAILSRLAWIYLPVTVALSLVSISIWSFYRIDKDTHEKNLAGVQRAMATAEREAESLSISE